MHKLPLKKMYRAKLAVHTRKSRKKKEPKTGWKAELISWIQVLVSAAVIAFVLTTFVIANSEVPTGSMENTIMTKSRVIGSRLHYTFGSPKRGDVAIFVFGWQCPECGVMVEGDKQEVCPACDSEIGRRGKTVYYVKRALSGGTYGSVGNLPL